MAITKIYNIDDLQNINNDLAGDYELANDIDANGYDFQPIEDFTGTFDGDDYTISNLTINRSGADASPIRPRPLSDEIVSGVWTVFPTSPTTLYDKVDEESADDDTTYIQSSEVGARVLFGCSINIPEFVKITQVRVYARRKRIVSGTSTQFIRINDINYDGSSTTPSTSYGITSTGWSINPATGNSWTASEVNNLDFGVVNVSGTVRFTQVYLYVTYTINYLGLFGSIENAIIKNVNLEDVSITGSISSNYVGALVGYGYDSVIENININNVIIRDFNYYIGGIVGYLYSDINSSISDSSAVGVDIYSETGGRHVGGIAGISYGYNSTCIIENCNADVSINIGSYNAGGIVGGVWGNDIITECYSSGSVSCLYNGGGCCGYLETTGIISKSFSTVDIICSADYYYSGGFIAENYGLINNCYSIGTVNQDAAYSYSGTGGFCGRNQGVITNSYSVGAVVGEGTNIGGFCGLNLAQIVGSFWDIETSGRITGIGLDELISSLNWTLTTNRSYSGSYSAYCGDIDTFLYENYQLSVMTLKDSVNLSATTSPSLDFYLWPDIETSFDFLYVDVSIDNGLTWSTNVWNHTGGGREWLSESVDLSSYKYSQVKIRFRFTSDSSVVYEGPYIDDVEIKDGVNVIFSDGFEFGSDNWLLEPEGNSLEGKTTIEMQTKSTFTNVGWDFVNIWGIGNYNDDYPYLLDNPPPQYEILIPIEAPILYVEWANESPEYIWPTADFSSNVTHLCHSGLITFTDVSTNASGWNWVFSGGVPSGAETQGPHEIYYSGFGVYDVSLSVVNDYGGDTETKVSYIKISEDISTPDFEADITDGCLPLEVNFTDLSTQYPDDWVWNFGDGSYSYEQNPTHIYTAEGIYDVTLSVSNACSVVSSGIVGHWKLNEDPAVHDTEIVDASGENNHGILKTSDGITNKSTTGKINTAITFDGSNDYILIPTANVVDVVNLCVDATASPSATGGFVVNAASLAIVTTPYWVGQEALRIDPTGTDSFAQIEGYGVTLGMEANKTYTAQARIYVPAATGLSPDDSRGIAIQFYTRETGGSYVRTGSSRPIVTDEWVLLTVTFTVANNPDQAFIRLYNGFGTAGKYVYWDGIQVEEGDTAHDWGFGSHTHGEIIDSWDFEWGSNNDLISDHEDWSSSTPDSSTATISTTRAFTGTRSLQLSRDGGALSAWISHTAGTGYGFRARCYNAADSYAGMQHGNGSKLIRVKYIDANLKWVDSTGSWVDTGFDIGATEWAWLEVRNIDWTAGTFDIYHNGLLAKQDATMASSSGGNGIIVFVETKASKSSWWDNFEVFEDWADSSLNSGNTRSIAAWVYPVDTTRRSVFSHGSNTAGGFQFEINGQGAGSFGVIIAGVWVYYSDVALLTNNQWNHIAYTRSGSGSGTHKLYLNGSEVGSPTYDAANDFTNQTYHSLIGARNTTSQLWNGIIDDVRVYDRALSQVEISLIYNEGNGTEDDLKEFISETKTDYIIARDVPVADFSAEIVSGDNPLAVGAVLEDFEWGYEGSDITNSGGEIQWSKIVYGQGYARISTTQSFSGTRSLELYRDGNNTGDTYASFTQIAGEWYNLEAKLRGDDTNSDLLFWHGNGSKLIRVRIGYRAFNKEIGYYHDGGWSSSGVAVNINEWNTIKISNIDWSAGTYSIYLNGDFIQSAIMFTSSSWANAVLFRAHAGEHPASIMRVDDVNVSNIVGTAPLTIQFTDSSSGYPTTWVWDFGDGEVSTDQNPQHIYNDSGVYAVTLQANNNCGLNTLSKNRYISVTPTASFSSDVTTGNAPLVVRFSDTSVGNPSSWSWDINGNGIEDYNIQNPKHTYVNISKYTVVLTAFGAGGSHSITKTNYITTVTPPEREKQIKTPIIEAIVTRYYEGQLPGTDTQGFNYYPEVINCDITHGFDQATSSCTLVIKTPTDVDGNLVKFEPMDRVRIKHGWNAAKTLRIMFLGFIDTVELISPGGEQRLECRDILKLPQENHLIHSNRKVYFKDPVEDELDENGNPMGGQPSAERSAWYIIRTLLIESGIGTHRQVLDVELKNIIIGNNAVAVFVYESALDAINRICDLVGYRIWADEMGCIRCKELSNIATESPAVTYRSKVETYNEDGTWSTITDGDLIKVTSMKSDDLRNWITVVGWDELKSTVIGDSPYVTDPPKYRRAEVRTYLLDTSQLLVAVANRIYFELNRLRYTASAEIEGDQELRLGMIVKIYDPFAYQEEVNYILHSFTSNFSVGSWTMNLNLAGGVGEGSPPSGRMAPLSIFNHTISREKLHDGFIVEVTVDASESYSPEGYGLSYLWNCDGFSDSTDKIHVYEMEDRTEPLIVTLKVTDNSDETLSDTTTKTIYLLGEEGAEIKEQAIFAISGTNVYSTINSGIDWFVDDIGETLLCVGACHETRHAFVGTTNGNLWLTVDGFTWELFYEMSELHSPAVPITAVAVDYKASYLKYWPKAIVYFGTSDGRLYRTDSGGYRWENSQWVASPYSWKLMWTFSTAIRKIRSNNASMWRPVIATDDGIWISTNAGRSWSLSLSV